MIWGIEKFIGKTCIGSVLRQKAFKSTEYSIEFVLCIPSSLQTLQDLNIASITIINVCISQNHVKLPVIYSIHRISLINLSTLLIPGHNKTTRLFQNVLKDIPGKSAISKQISNFSMKCLIFFL